MQQLRTPPVDMSEGEITVAARARVSHDASHTSVIVVSGQYSDVAVSRDDQFALGGAAVIALAELVIPEYDGVTS